jgi:ubiquinone/menaquinone biosynthesis C-methylase UbiE
MSAAREMKLVARAYQLALAEVERPAVVLDYPCGAGRFAPLFAGGADGYVAGDHSPHMIAIATEVLQKAGLGDKLRSTTEGDARSMNIKDNSVDLAASMRLLHHFPKREDRLTILRELRRVSKGPLVASFLDAASVKQKNHMRRCRKRGETSPRVMVTHAEFREEAREAGWELRQTWSLSSLFSGQCVALLLPAA